MISAQDLACFVGLSNFYSYTRCSYATNIFTITIKFSIKNLLAKPPSSSQRKKAQEGKIKTPRSSCTMRAQPLPGPRHQVTGVSLLPHHCPTPTVVHHPAVRAQGVHISLLVVDSLGLTVRAPSSKPSKVT